jgi:uncharacterized protein YaaN involved in tellurite resistance
MINLQNKTEQEQTQVAEPTTAQTPKENFSLAECRQGYIDDFKKTGELEKYTAKIEVFDPNSIVKFGSEAAEEVSKSADVVLNGMNIDQINNSGKMLEALDKIMGSFDIDEVKEDKGLFGKLFGNAKKKLEKLLSKYNTMGDEIDKIYTQLKVYEGEIEKSNRNLDQMFNSNLEYYHELVKYIAAGEQGCKELHEYIEQKEQELATSNNVDLQFEISNLRQAENMLEQRVMDLKTAESIALQSIPMIKTMEFSNANLTRKINSAFIVTLPVFKQALAQTMMLKRQKIQADSMSALDKRTNELLIKNAQNTVEQSKQITRMTNTSSVQIETLEKTWNTIVSGIDETKRIQEEAKREREEDSKRLDAIKQQYAEKMKGL